MKKSENPAKLSKGCKKRAKKCKFIPKYSMLTCFFFKRTYQRTKKKLVGFEGGRGCTVGYLSPWPTRYTRKTTYAFRTVKTEKFILKRFDF
jgi:hypothetical protein